MFRVLLGLVLCIAAQAQNPNTAAFPGRVATDADLFVAANSAQSTLNGTLTSGATSITLNNSTGFTAPIIVVLGQSEIVHCTTNTPATNILSGCTRGLESTSAVGHNNGDSAYGLITAWHHNQLSIEIQAIETAALHVVATPVIYYVCGKANGSTCGSTDTVNLWHSNAVASPTISDANACTTIAAPCRTINGVFGKINNALLINGAIVTVYLADTVNTGSDCYAENADLLSVVTAGLMSDVSGEHAIGASFPPSYVYVYGNPTTPANVTLAGNGCGVTSVGNINAMSFHGAGAVRINGFQLEGYGSSTKPLGAAIVAATGSVLFLENQSCIGDGTGANHSACAAAFGSGILRVGGTNTITGQPQMGYAAVEGGMLYTWDPLASSSANASYTWTAGSGADLFVAQEHSAIYMDRTTVVTSGTENSGGAVLFADLASAIIYVEEYTGAGQCPNSGKCFDITLNTGGSSFYYQFAAENSFIDADCTTATQSNCAVTQQPTFHSRVDVNSSIRNYSFLSGFSSPITAGDDIRTGCILYPQNSADDNVVCNFGNPSNPSTLGNFVSGLAQDQKIAYGNSSFMSGNWIGYHVNGSLGSPAATSGSSWTLASYIGGGHDGTSLRQVGGVRVFLPSGTWSGTNRYQAAKLTSFAKNTTTELDTVMAVNGHIGAPGNSPSAGTCGTSPSIDAGSSDSVGTITVGGGTVTSCAVNFGVAFGQESTRAPKCVVSFGSATNYPTNAVLTTTTSALTITTSATTMASQPITWHCFEAKGN